MPTNPPASPLPGAVYVDQSTNIVWVYSGTYWLQAHGGAQNYNQQRQPTTAIVPGYFSEPSPDSWLPFVGSSAPLSPACGQIWINNSITPNTAQVWDCNASAWIQLGGTAGGDTNSIVTAAAPTVRLSGYALETGDLWIDPVAGGMSFWNGTGWNPISSTDTHSIYSTVIPGSRTGGYPLVAGDLWTDPSANTLKYWTGTAWTPVEAVDADHQLSPTAPLLRPDGNALTVADLWTNTTSNTLFYWSGTSWDRYNDSHSFQQTGQPLTRPDLTPLQGGDQWFNPTTDFLYVYDSTSFSWALVTSPDTHSFFNGTEPAVRDNGTVLLNGDLWVSAGMNSYGYHDLKVWHASVWHDVGTQDSHAFIGTTVPTPVSVPLRLDGRPLGKGDTYINTTSKSSYYWSGTSWEEFNSNACTVSIPSLTQPTVRPNSLALAEGDRWIDINFTPTVEHTYVSGSWRPNGSVSVVSTLPASGSYNNQILVNSTDNRMYRWDTSAWVQVVV